jgi:hypothetical protein
MQAEILIREKHFKEAEALLQEVLKVRRQGMIERVYSVCVCDQF